MSRILRILLVEDSEDDALLLIRELRRGGYDPTYERVDTPEDMKAALARQIWDIVISDYVMPKFSGLAALKVLQESGIDLPFIIVSGKIGEDFAVEAMKAGAHDYLIKDKLVRLSPAIARELREAEVRREHKRNEKALLESERRFRRTFETIPDPAYLWVRQADWSITLMQANKAAYNVTKGEIGDSLGIEVEKLFPGMLERLKYTMDTGETQREELCLRLPTGEERWFLTEYAKTDDNSVLTITNDITEWKKAKEALSESEERYRSLFEESRDTIYITSREGKFIDINQAGLELFGYSRDEMMSLNVMELYAHPVDRVTFQKEIEQNGSVRNYEVKLRKKDGTVIDCLLTSTMRQTNDGSILGYQGIIHDITERKQEEEKIKKYTENLEKMIDKKTRDLMEVQRLLAKNEIKKEDNKQV